MWSRFSILIFFTGNFNTRRLSSSAVWDHPLQLLFLWRRPLANLQYFTVRPFYAVAFSMLTFYADIFHPLLLVPAHFFTEFLFYNCGYSVSMSLNSLH